MPILQRKMDTCIFMSEFLCCPPETITTLLISYTPITNGKFLKNNTLIQHWNRYSFLNIFPPLL